MRASLRRLFRISNPPAGPLSFGARRRSWKLRLQIMRQHTWLLTAAVLLLCAGVGGIVYHLNTLPTTLRFAVGPPNSQDVRVVQAIAAQLARERANIRLNINVLDGGTRAAMAAIDNDQADLAVVRRDNGMPKEGQVVAILRKNVVTFIVPSVAEPAEAPKGKAAKGKAAAKAKKPVEKLSELIGKRIGVIGTSPNNVDMLKVILRQYGIGADKIAMLEGDDRAKPNAPDKISVVQFATANVGSAIKDSNVDVIMSVGPVGSPITAEAIAAATRGKEPPTFLAIGAAEAIAEREPIYESGEIKAGAFGGSPPRPEESVETIEVHHYIVARKQLTESVVADFTKHLFAIRQNLTAELPAAAKIEKPDTDKDAPVPVHPGASAYLDGELKSFFDRYNDLLYWGLMLFTLFGSGFAGLWSYSKADDRVARLQPLDRLLEIAKAARTADSIQALDGMQSEMDEIQVGMVHEVEAGNLDQIAMMAYSMSFEQARIAISDRRSMLQSQPPRPLAAVASL